MLMLPQLLLYHAHVHTCSLQCCLLLLTWLPCCLCVDPKICVELLLPATKVRLSALAQNCVDCMPCDVSVANACPGRAAAAVVAV